MFETNSVKVAFGALVAFVAFGALVAFAVPVALAVDVEVWFSLAGADPIVGCCAADGAGSPEDNARKTAAPSTIAYNGLRFFFSYMVRFA
jgi:hypothetical protein